MIFIMSCGQQARQAAFTVDDEKLAQSVVAQISFAVDKSAAEAVLADNMRCRLHPVSNLPLDRMRDRGIPLAGVLRA